MFLADIPCGLWDLQALLRVPLSMRGSHSQKEGEGGFATVLSTFGQGPCRPTFASPPGKLLPDTLSEAVTLCLLAVRDTLRGLVESRSLRTEGEKCCQYPRTVPGEVTSNEETEDIE